MIYYTVFDSGGNKIADCGTEHSAKRLSECRKGTYKTNRLEWKETVTILPLEQSELPTRDITVNMDGGVGGSWKVEESEYIEVQGQKLQIQQSEQPKLEL